MVRHQAVGMADPAKTLNDSTKDFEEATPIGVVEEDLRPRVPATGDVVQSAFVFEPQWSSHAASVVIRTRGLRSGLGAPKSNGRPQSSCRLLRRREEQTTG